MCDEQWQEAFEEIYAAGVSMGESAAAWLLDGNSTREEAQALLDGINDGDPLVLDALPTLTLGEWAGDPTIEEIIDEVCGLDVSNISAEEIQDLFSAYNDGFSDGVQSGAAGEAARFLNA